MTLAPPSPCPTFSPCVYDTCVRHCLLCVCGRQILSTLILGAGGSIMVFYEIIMAISRREAEDCEYCVFVPVLLYRNVAMGGNEQRLSSFKGLAR